MQLQGMHKIRCFPKRLHTELLQTLRADFEIDKCTTIPIAVLVITGKKVEAIPAHPQMKKPNVASMEYYSATNRSMFWHMSQ